MARDPVAPARAFVDTNVLVYAFDDADVTKQDRAWQLLQSLQEEGAMVLSTQVLQEFYVTVTRKLARPLDPEAAERAVGHWMAFPVVQVDPRMILAGIGRSRKQTLSLWDALIVEAAVHSGCRKLFTEDLQPGAWERGLDVVNPFAPS